MHRMNNIVRQSIDINSHANTSRFINDMSQLAKMRRMQAELINEKMINQQLEAKCLAHIERMQQMHTELVKMDQQIRRLRQSQIISIQKNQQLIHYEANILSIGQEMTKLNQTLIRRNKDYELIRMENGRLKDQNQDMRRKFGKFSEEYQLCYTEIDQIISILQTQKDGISFNNDLVLRLRFIKGQIQQLKKQKKKGREHIEKIKKENSDSLMSERQRYIKLQYELKLLKQRMEDGDKKKIFLTNFMNEQRIEQTIEQMLKKEDQLTTKIQYMQQLLENQKKIYEEQIIQIQCRCEERIKEMNLKIIEVENTNLNILKQNVRLRESFTSLQQRYEQLTITTERHKEGGQVKLMRKLRTSEEQNKLLQMQIQQLRGQNNILKKQIEVLRE